jgi:hypothetical protein
MHDLSFLDETLDINITNTYHISIQVSLNGFSFCLLDTARNKYVALKHYEFDTKETTLEENIKRVSNEDEFLNKEYKSSSLIFTTRKFTLVPTPIFNKEYLKKYFSFNHNLEESERIYFNHLRNADAYVIFTIPGNLSDIFNYHFPKIKIYHQSTPFIESILRNHINSQDKHTMFLNAGEDLFDIAVVHLKNLKLYNCFFYKNENDLIYFVLYVYEYLKLDAEKTVLVISGSLLKSSKHYEILKKYIRNLRFEQPKTQFTYSYTFNEIPSHTFVNLLNLYTCE